MQELTILLLVLIELQLLYLLFRPNLKRRGRNAKSGAVYIDSSALIDGRILDAVKAGFIPPYLVIPKSVLSELQLLADGGDSDKRVKARHGLDVASQLREEPAVKVDIIQDGETKSVDDRLIELARASGGSICTLDFNLNKVATVEGIRVLNVNELARQLKMTYMPGETVSLQVIQKGNDNDQGVGYLADGTMVVIEKAGKDVGKTIEVEFIRSIQTAAGRMLFAKKRSASQTNVSKKPKAKGRKPTAASAEASLVDLANK